MAISGTLLNRLIDALETAGEDDSRVPEDRSKLRQVALGLRTAAVLIATAAGRIGPDWGRTQPDSQAVDPTSPRPSGPSNTKVTNPFEFVTFCLAVRRTAQLWAKGDLNPHVPKDTGT
jgi:hypothetical protein